MERTDSASAWVPLGLSGLKVAQQRVALVLDGGVRLVVWQRRRP
jgi:hypothetical protein